MTLKSNKPIRNFLKMFGKRFRRLLILLEGGWFWKYHKLAKLCMEKGLKKPEFIQELDFKTILYRPILEENQLTTGQVTGQVAGQVTGQVTEKIMRLLNVINHQSLSVKEMMQHLSLSGRDNFLKEYLIPAIEQDLATMKYPQNPNHPKQRYYLTEKGLSLL